MPVWDRTVCSVFSKPINPPHSLVSVFSLSSGRKQEKTVSFSLRWKSTSFLAPLCGLPIMQCYNLRKCWRPRWRHSRENSIHPCLFLSGLLSKPVQWHNTSEHTAELIHELWRQVKPVAHLHPKKPELFSKLNYFPPDEAPIRCLSSVFGTMFPIFLCVSLPLWEKE